MKKKSDKHKCEHAKEERQNEYQKNKFECMKDMKYRFMVMGELFIPFVIVS